MSLIVPWHERLSSCNAATMNKQQYTVVCGIDRYLGHFGTLHCCLRIFYLRFVTKLLLGFYFSLSFNNLRMLLVPGKFVELSTGLMSVSENSNALIIAGFSVQIHLWRSHRNAQAQVYFSVGCTTVIYLSE